MVKKRVIPCLDVAGGRVVKGVNFVDLREMGEPIALATRYSELGADELVFLDITATLEGRGPILEPDRARSRRADDPLHRRRWSRRASTMPAHSCGPEPTRSPSIARPSTTHDPHRPRGRVRLPGGRLRDRRPRGRSRHACRSDPPRTGRCRLGPRRGRAGRRRAARHVDRCIGTRAGYDLPLTEAVATAVEVPVIASGGAGKRPISEMHSASGPRRRSSRRSCTSGPSVCPS